MVTVVVVDTYEPRKHFLLIASVAEPLVGGAFFSNYGVEDKNRIAEASTVKIMLQIF